MGDIIVAGHRRHILTRALWAGNALAVVALLAVVLFRFSALIWGSEAALPDIRPLQLAALPTLPMAEAPGERNPFDPTGMAWREAKDDKDVTGGGELKGIIVLPGVRLAVTDRGSVKAGEVLGAGKVVAIEERAVVIDSGSGRQPIETPGTRRPRLQDLNRASRPAPAPVEGKS